MPTQENCPVGSTGNPLYVATAALCSVLTASQSNWIWSSLYLQTQSVGDLLLAFGILCGVVVAGVYALNLILGKTAALKLLHFALVVVLFFIVCFAGLKELGFVPHTITLWQKVLAVASASCVAGLLAFNVDAAKWVRIYPAAIVAGLGFALSPWLFAEASAPTTYWPSSSQHAATAPGLAVPNQNTIIVLLDEFSASAAAPVIDSLEEAGLNVHASSITPSGKDTINVIPAIWLRRNFDRSAPCGPTQLCSGSNVLDFARTKAASGNIDVLAFYHQYCAIKGLRSCHFYTPRKKSAITELACRLLLMPSIRSMDCKPSEADRNYFSAQREEMQQAVMEAPFWREGGILYAHLLQPHPLMGIAARPLNAEYADNVDNSATFIKRVAQKAEATFGNNFRLIVFSDHPLRPNMWCGAEGFYQADQCKPDPTQLSDQVPLIIATAKENRWAAPVIDSNQKIFDLLFN
jgi:hypothetical protein